MAPKPSNTATADTGDKRANKELYEIKKTVDETAKTFEKFQHQVQDIRELIANQTSDLQIQCSEGVESKLDALQNDVVNRFERIDNALSERQDSIPSIDPTNSLLDSLLHFSDGESTSSDVSHRPNASVVTLLQNVCDPARKNLLSDDDHFAINDSIREGNDVARKLLLYINMLEYDLKKLTTDILPTWYQRMVDAETEARQAVKDMNTTAGREKKSREHTDAIEVSYKDRIAAYQAAEAGYAAKERSMQQMQRDLAEKAAENEQVWNDKIGDLNRQIQGHKHDKTLLDNEVRQLRTAISELESTERGLRKQIQSLEEQLRKLHKQQALASDATENPQQMTEKVDGLTENIKQLQLELEEQKKASKALQIRSNLLSTTEQANRDLKKKLEDRERKLKALDEKVKEMQKVQVAAETARKEALDELEASRKKSEAMEKECAELTNNNRAGDKRAKKLEKKQQNLMSKNEELERKHRNVVAELGPTKAELKSLREQHTLAKKNNSSAPERLAAMHICHDDLYFEKNKLQGSIDALQAEIHVLQHEKEISQKEEVSRKAHIAELNGWIKIIEQEKQVEASKATNSDMRCKVEELANKELKIEISILENELAILRGQLPPHSFDTPPFSAASLSQEQSPIDSRLIEDVGLVDSKSVGQQAFTAPPVDFSINTPPLQQQFFFGQPPATSAVGTEKDNGNSSNQKNNASEQGPQNEKKAQQPLPPQSLFSESASPKTLFGNPVSDNGQLSGNAAPQNATFFGNPGLPYSGSLFGNPSPNNTRLFGNPKPLLSRPGAPRTTSGSIFGTLNGRSLNVTQSTSPNPVQKQNDNQKTVVANTSTSASNTKPSTDPGTKANTLSGQTVEPNRHPNPPTNQPQILKQNEQAKESEKPKLQAEGHAADASGAKINAVSGENTKTNANANANTPKQEHDDKDKAKATETPTAAAPAAKRSPFSFSGLFGRRV
ncbi:MAG: hypothetical protein Q9227_002554 [Pyrenula ochraceoflavens]